MSAIETTSRLQVEKEESTIGGLSWDYLKSQIDEPSPTFNLDIFYVRAGAKLLTWFCIRSC